MTGGATMNSGLLANLVGRVILAFVGILLCWVPFRLLLRNGEFAAVVLIVDVVIMNLITIVNSLIWHNDDWNSWWDGAGLCDIEVYLSVPMQTIYAASIFTIMYHLAQQVKVARPGHNQGEKTKRSLIQAAIIFPIPLIQLSFTYFDLAQRYIIGTLIGCSAVYDSSWPKNLVFDAPSAIFALISVPYAILLWKRYDAITKQTRSVLKSNSEASVRANRTRRRLYRMSLSILVVYLPVMLYYVVFNIKDTLSSYKAYDFHRIRESASPYPWGTILFVPSWIIPSLIMNQPWIPIATSVAIVSFFGTTVEAQEIYWRYAKSVGIEPFLRKLQWKKNRATDQADESTGTRVSRKVLLPHPARNSLEYQ
ncbi:GPCR fungal pheromone mating factor [Xylaria intraflava]|nr:GPCR fungal pheromone mating factor [Xylaria intraflava]